MEVRLSHSVKTCSPTCVNVSGSVREVIITVCPDLATHSTNIFLSLRLFASFSIYLQLLFTK